LEKAAKKIVTRRENMTLCVPFTTWRQQIDESARLKSCCEKVVRRWLSLSLAEAWRTWTAKVADRSRLQELGSKIIKRWKNQALSSCFLRWVSRVYESKNMKVKAKKVLANWSRSSIALAFGLWLELVDEKDAAAAQDQVSAQVAAAEAAEQERNRAALKGLREEILKMEKASIAGTFGFGQGSKRQQELAGSIAFFALSVWQRQAARSSKAKLQFRIQVHQKTISNLGYEANLSEKMLNHMELVV
jgi:hypothetical protein